MKSLSFPEALRAAKSGCLITRQEWTGKSMFVFMRPSDELSVEFLVEKVKSLPLSLKAWYFKRSQRREMPMSIDSVKFSSYLCMKSTDDSILNGWSPSQTDMLSNDWEIIESTLN